MTHTAQQELPRMAMLEKGSERGLSKTFIGTVDDIKALAESSGFKVLYMLRVTDVPPGAPGRLHWVMWKLRVNPETFGHA